jgi:hypothetical protein
VLVALATFVVASIAGRGWYGRGHNYISSVSNGSCKGIAFTLFVLAGFVFGSPDSIGVKLVLISTIDGSAGFIAKSISHLSLERSPCI